MNIFFTEGFSAVPDFYAKCGAGDVIGQVFSLFVNFFTFFPERCGNILQYRFPGRPVLQVHWRKIGAAEKGFALRSKKYIERRSPSASNSLNGIHIDLV